MQQESFFAWSCVGKPGAPVANETAQIALGAAELGNLIVERGEFFLGEPEDAAAWGAAGVARAQNFGKFGKSESEMQSLLYQAHAIDGARGIHAVAGVCARRGGKDAEFFVVAEGIRADACQAGEFSGAQRFEWGGHAGKV